MSYFLPKDLSLGFYLSWSLTAKKVYLGNNSLKLPVKAKKCKKSGN